MRASLSLRTAFVAFTLVSFSAAQVRAAPVADAIEPAPDDAAAFEQAAIDAFEAGRYDQAVENFERAFALDANPNNLFNIGRVYEEVGDFGAAVDYYKRFIAQPKVSLDNRKIALERIEVLEQIIAKTQSAAVEPEPEPESPAPVIAAQPVAIDDVDSSDEQRRRKQRAGGYVLLGLGGAGLIAGGIAGGLAAGTERELADSSEPEQRTKLVERGDAAALAADVLLIAGGTLALVGLIVTLTALPKRNQQRTALAPVFDAHGGGVVVLHRF